MFCKLLKLFSLSLILLVSCAEEDPDLVNSPPQSETVRVRLFNLADDRSDRTLVLDGKVKIGPVPYGNISKAIQPPADSSFPSILLNGVEEYRSTKKIRFTSKNYYTVFALPSYPNDTIPYAPMDTLITASTLSNLFLQDDYSYLRMFNGVRDSSRKYTVRIGCPNGTPIASFLSFMKLSSQAEVVSGKLPVSIIRQVGQESEFIGLFELELIEKKQYMIIAIPDKDNPNEEKFYLLDEFEESTSAMMQIFPIPAELLGTQVRAINMSDNDISFHKEPNVNHSNPFASLQGKFVGSYTTVDACSGSSSDTFSAVYQSQTSSTVSASLNVSSRYSFLTFDNDKGQAKFSIMAEPHRVKPNGMATVRVIHASYKLPSLTLSMAARDDNPNSNNIDSLGYRSGDLISAKISYGNISNPIRVRPGNDMPITVFTSSQPANMINISVASFEPDKDYLLIITYDKNADTEKLYLIEENDENFTPVPLLKGVFAQFVNLVPGVSKLELKLDPVLTRAKLNYGATLATVISEGDHYLKVNNRDTTINVNSSQRLLFVFGGDEKEIDFLPFTYKALENSPALYQRRFINASKSTKSIGVKENSDTAVKSLFVLEDLPYGKMSNTQPVTLNRNLSLFFIDFNSKKTLYRVDDLPFPFGKNYTIIFGGRASDKSYSVVVLQEY